MIVGREVDGKGSGFVRSETHHWGRKQRGIRGLRRRSQCLGCRRGLRRGILKRGNGPRRAEVSLVRVGDEVEGREVRRGT